MTTSSEYRYSLRPLLELSGLGQHAAMAAVGASGQRWIDADNAGLRWPTADRWAVRLGFHPYEVWPEMAHDALAVELAVCEACDTEYEPVIGGAPQRYCSQRCAVRIQARRRRARQRQAVAS